MWLRIETSILCNRSFAAGNSSRAKHKLGQNKQKDHITENCNFLCLCSFNESLALQHGGFVPGEWIASCKGPRCADPDWRFSKDYHISDSTNTYINLANADLKRFAARRWFPPCTRWGCNGKRDEATDSYRRFKSTILPLQRALDKADTLTSYRMRLARTNKIEWTILSR